MHARTIIQKTLRVPRGTAASGDGAAVARQMDAVLAGVGFKATRELLEHVSGMEPGAAIDLATDVVGAVRALVGDQAEHNAYFLDFPRGVPDTVEFWVSCLRAAFAAANAEGLIDPRPAGLLDLPRYGRYQHTYAELLAAHDELVGSLADRVTVVRLGGTLGEETEALYRALAESVTPLGEADLGLLAELADVCGDVEPAAVPVRENRAVLNAARLAAGRPLLAVDTVVDVLRTACQASGGDVTLAEPTRFRGFTRRERRVLLAALDGVVAGDEGKLGDVARFARRFKRLGERLHPHDYPRFPGAGAVFAVARGERTARSLAGRAEAAFAAHDVAGAAAVLTAAPGMLLRSLDRLLRQANVAEQDTVLDAAEGVLGSVSGRVLCSVREHLVNRVETDTTRVFTTRSRRAWVTEDTRPPLPRTALTRACALIDAELTARLPRHERLMVDPAVLDVALPLSGKASEDGFAVLPRGSRGRVDGEVLRFFTYWRQSRVRTDFDLSALLLDARFRFLGHVSWTRYQDGGAVYSGDLTEAPDGATEFIDIPLGGVDATYVVPQVDIYSGEGFDEVAESMFGWMTRDHDQAGAPFEARTVRTRSDLRGTGRVALPIVFARDDDGAWTATWLHLYLSGQPSFNRVETNHAGTAVLARGLLRRDYLTVGYLVDLMRAAGTEVTTWEPGTPTDEPVTFLGIHEPEHLPEGSEVITLDRLNRLIPA
ncbi:TerD family protein [Amycolatopsis samaneae]|uniref:TerD domain-containing protein n=1 Tax=Amycolatopsis samaneae TaxID=664691 RepID=A0ABW5GDG3_9PSEU